MKVKDFIDVLQQANPEAILVLYDREYTEWDVVTGIEPAKAPEYLSQPPAGAIRITDT